MDETFASDTPAKVESEDYDAEERNRRTCAEYEKNIKSIAASAVVALAAAHEVILQHCAGNRASTEEIERYWRGVIGLLNQCDEADGALCTGQILERLGSLLVMLEFDDYEE